MASVSKMAGQDDSAAVEVDEDEDELDYSSEEENEYDEVDANGEKVKYPKSIRKKAREFAETMRLHGSVMITHMGEAI